MVVEKIITEETVADGYNGNGQIVKLTSNGYTNDSTVLVYIEDDLIDSENYRIFYSEGFGEYVLHLEKCLQGYAIGSTIRVHIGKSIASDSDTETDLEIYIPKDYSSIADIPADLKKMAESIQKIINNLRNNRKEETDPTVPNFVKEITEEDIEGWKNKSEFSGNYEDLSNKPQIPDVSKFVDNTVDDLLNYYLKNETYSKEEVKTVINNRINELVDGAPATFDTLKEIADYIAEHEEIARALNEAIGNKVDKETGKSLISDTEIERLSGVDNYNDTEVRQKITDIETEQTTQNETIEENINKITANVEEIGKLREENVILRSQFPMRRDRRREYYVDR